MTWSQNLSGIHIYPPNDCDESFIIKWDIVIYCAVILMVFFRLGLIAAMAATAVPQRRGVIWQCTFRSNFAIIGVSLAAALGGEEAVAVAAIISSFTFPLFKILAVIADVLGIGCVIILSTHTNILLCGVHEFPALIAMFSSPLWFPVLLWLGPWEQMGN